jgi:8-oxo-dGTP diphosphatase
MMDKNPKLQSVHAILLLSDKYILQLRDNKADISDPGQWSLFGGVLDGQESPIHAIKREIYEELLIEPADFQLLWYIDHYATFEKKEIRSWFFKSDVSLVWLNHSLKEGQSAKTFSFPQIKNLHMPDIMKQSIICFDKKR